jgi:hypothetical protein
MKIIRNFIFLILSLLLHSLIETLTMKKKKDSANPPEIVPIINVHMEEPDRDPIEVKRIEEERKIEKNRIRDMEFMEETDKKIFQKIIAVQSSQLSRLEEISSNTDQLLKDITGGLGDAKERDSYKPPTMISAFKQIEPQTKANGKRTEQHNGPINFNTE